MYFSIKNQPALRKICKFGGITVEGFVTHYQAVPAHAKVSDVMFLMSEL